MTNTIRMRVRLDPSQWPAEGAFALTPETLAMCLRGSGLKIVDRVVITDGHTLVDGDANIWPDYYENEPGSSWWVEAV